MFQFDYQHIYYKHHFSTFDMKCQNNVLIIYYCTYSKLTLQHKMDRSTILTLIINAKTNFSFCALKKNKFGIEITYHLAHVLKICVGKCPHFEDIHPEKDNVVIQIYFFGLSSIIEAEISFDHF